MFRLAVNIEKETVSRILERIEADVTSFLSQIEKELIDVKKLGIQGVTYQEVLEEIRNYYGLK